MPLFDYECPKGHVHERMERADCKTTRYCPTCGSEATRLISAPRIPADGKYSYKAGT